MYALTSSPNTDKHTATAIVSLVVIVGTRLGRSVGDWGCEVGVMVGLSVGAQKSMVDLYQEW